MLPELTSLCLLGELAGIKREVHLEPLLGHLRHPFSVQNCIPPAEQVNALVIALCMT